MKRRLMMVIAVAALLALADVPALMAQNAPGGGRGCGYGGPPQSEAERAARREACGANGNGPCVTGEPRGRGQGAGRGMRRGARDGTGPRAQGGTCPMGPAAPQR